MRRRQTTKEVPPEVIQAVCERAKYGGLASGEQDQGQDRGVEGLAQGTYIQISDEDAVYIDRRAREMGLAFDLAASYLMARGLAMCKQVEAWSKEPGGCAISYANRMLKQRFESNLNETGGKEHATGQRQGRRNHPSKGGQIAH